MTRKQVLKKLELHISWAYQGLLTKKEITEEALAWLKMIEEEFGLTKEWPADE